MLLFYKRCTLYKTHSIVSANHHNTNIQIYTQYFISIYIKTLKIDKQSKLP